MFSNSLFGIGCLSQIKPFTSATHQYVNNVLAVTVESMFVMPYHGLVVCFKFKKFARLEISTSVINIIIAGEREGDRRFSSNFAFVRIFRKFLGCLVASCTVLF